MIAGLREARRRGVERDILADFVDPAMQRTGAGLDQQQPFAARRAQHVLDVPLRIKAATGGIRDA
ncbi:hypothetical protein D3C72_2578900 [compost metagenome]